MEEQGWLWPEVKEPQELRRRAWPSVRCSRRLRKTYRLVLHIDDLHRTDVIASRYWSKCCTRSARRTCCSWGGLPPKRCAEPRARSALGDGRAAFDGRRCRAARAEPLTYEDSVRLAAFSLGDQAESSQDAIRRIAEESQGLPLFVSELSSWQRTAAPDEASGLVSLDAVIRGRVDQLPAEGRVLLEVLCIAGGPAADASGRRRRRLERRRLAARAARVAKLTRTVASGSASWSIFTTA